MEDSAKASKIIEGHRRTIFMVEIKYDRSQWQATPKIFHSKKEAEKECEALIVKYDFIRECRVVTRKEKD